MGTTIHSPTRALLRRGLAGTHRLATLANQRRARLPTPLGHPCRVGGASAARGAWINRRDCSRTGGRDALIRNKVREVRWPWKSKHRHLRMHAYYVQHVLLHNYFTGGWRGGEPTKSPACPSRKAACLPVLLRPCLPASVTALHARCGGGGRGRGQRCNA